QAEQGRGHHGGPGELRLEGGNGRRTGIRPWRNRALLRLRAHSEREHGEQDNPPHDEVDREGGRPGHGKGTQACSSSTKVPQKSFGCRNNTGLPWAPILG